MQAVATATTTAGEVLEARSGPLAKDMLGFRTTRCPFCTNREIPPKTSRALRVATAGSPETTTRSGSPAACTTSGRPVSPTAAPAAAPFNRSRRVIPYRSVAIAPSPGPAFLLF